MVKFSGAEIPHNKSLVVFSHRYNYKQNSVKVENPERGNCPLRPLFVGAHGSEFMSFQVNTKKKVIIFIIALN